MRWLCTLGLVLAVCSESLADVPALMNNQGLLRTAGGVPIADGQYDIQFTLYKSKDDWAPLWTEVVPAVNVTRGFYSTVMGQFVPLPQALFEDHAELWLGIRVQGYPELPRQRLLTVAYAFEAGHAMLATVAEGLECTGCVATKALGFDLCAATATCEKSLDDVSCPADGILRVGKDGAWTCSTDRDTQYSAGIGLTLMDNVFYVDHARIVDWAKAACYDTQEELANALSGTFALASHAHDDRYYTKAQSDAAYAKLNHFHDDRYYTKAQVDSGFSALTHDHDGRYFTKDQTNSLVSGLVSGVIAGPGLTGGGTAGDVTISIAPGGVTNAMLANPGLTVSAGPGLSGGGLGQLGGSVSLSVAVGGITTDMLAKPGLTISVGPGLSGGGLCKLGESVSLSIPTGGVTNEMLANNSLTVTAGPGLTGGGQVALGASTTLSLAPPTATTLGGLKASTCDANSKVSGVDTSGNLTCAAEYRPLVYMVENNARVDLTCNGAWNDYLTVPITVPRSGSKVVFIFSFSQPYEWNGPRSVWRAALGTAYFSNPKYYMYATGNWNVLPGGFSFMIPDVAAGSYEAKIQYKFYSGCWRMSDSYTSEAYNSLIVQVF